VEGLDEEVHQVTNPWARWAWQQLGGLVAVLLGICVAGLVDDDFWSAGTWIVFLVAWLLVTGALALVRLRGIRGAARTP
jgi:hypothetical protein